MKTIGSKEAKNAFGALRLEAMEDAYWGARAEEAAKDGFLGVEESEKFMKKILDNALRVDGMDGSGS